MSPDARPARVRDWQSRLHAVFREARRTPFGWGRQDCCTFMADCVRAVTDRDPMAGLRTYQSKAGAVRVLQQHGGLAALCAARLGAEITPALAQPGDVGMFRDDVEHSGFPDGLAVCGGADWFAAGPDGLVVLQLGAVYRAWGCC